ncbi:MAG: FAD-binding oxidoreductase [Xanthomonadales bacterium]|nr:FAD-binding oxidoreductase [Xanthomonadales bacterium]
MGTIRDRDAALDSWYATTAMPWSAQPRLEGRRRVDVAVLGGGLAGLSAALELAQRGLRVAVLEAHRVGWGASGRSGGQAIFGYGCDQSKITAMVGLADSRKLFAWSVEGVELVRQRIATHAIDCDWRDGHAHVPIKPRQVDELQAWQRDLEDNFDYPTEWWERERSRAEIASDRYLGALFDPKSGHLHPLNYTLGLARAALAAGVQIHEQSAVTQLLRGDGATRPMLRTAHGELEADFIVLAGNAYVQGIAPELDSRIMPVGTYIGATEPLGAERMQGLIRNGIAVADINWALDYFRPSADHRLLFGGRASYSTLQPLNLRATMIQRMTRVFPQLKGVRLDHVWGGYVDISLNRAPHWGRITPNIYFVQGFSGHGIASTGLAGRVIAEAITAQSHRLDLFAKIPHHPFPGGRTLRTPLLVAAMAWYKLRDALW